VITVRISGCFFVCVALAALFVDEASAGTLVPFRPVIGWDASDDDGSDSEWNPSADPFSGGHFWNVEAANEPTHNAFAADPDTQGITGSFDFADGATHTTESVMDNANPQTIKVGPTATDPTSDTASIELWFKPVSLSGGKQVLWSLGGATDGASLTLEDSILRFQYRDSDSPGTTGGNGDLVASIKTDLTSVGVGDFIQVVGTVDLINNEAELYVNGISTTAVNDSETGLFLSNTQTGGRDDNGFTVDSGAGTNPLATGATGGGAPADWSGSGAARLGRNTGDVGGTAKTASDPVDLQDFNNTFQGEIARVSIYRDTLTAHQVQTNYDAVANDQSRAVDYLVTSASATLIVDYDAEVGNGTTAWEDMAVIATSGNYDFAPIGSGSAVAHNSSTPANSTYPGIKAAYEFSGGEGLGMEDFQDFSATNSDFNDPTGTNASFEAWLRPSDLSGNELLFETGGTGDGVSLVLEDNLLKFQVKNGSQNSTSQFDLSTIRDGSTIGDDEFIQVIGIVNLDGDQTELWVDGVKRDTGGLDGTGTFTDWAGTDNTGIGAENGVTNFGNPDSFTGEVAIFRFYSGILSKTEIAQNFQAISGMAPVPEPSAFVLGALGLAAVALLRWGRRPTQGNRE